MRPQLIWLPRFCRGRIRRLTETSLIIARIIEKVNTFFEEFLKFGELILVPFGEVVAEEGDEAVVRAAAGGFMYNI